MVKKDCVKLTHELLDFHTDYDNLWDVLANLERGKGNTLDTADNVESYIKATDLRIFGEHHSKIVGAFEDIKAKLIKGDVTAAKIRMTAFFKEYDHIVTDLISECECGEFLVKTK